VDAVAALTARWVVFEAVEHDLSSCPSDCSSCLVAGVDWGVALDVEQLGVT